MMGRELEQIDKVGPGNIAAIGGLEHFIQKSATLSSTVFCPSFSGMHFLTSPIVQVATEPKNPCKLKNVYEKLLKPRKTIALSIWQEYSDES